MLLTTEELSEAYKSRKKGEPVFWAAKEVCVEIPEGKTVGLLGPSGSGKSTVGQMIVGLIEASSGGNFLQRRAPFLSVERGAAVRRSRSCSSTRKFPSIPGHAASDPEYGGTL